MVTSQDLHAALAKVEEARRELTNLSRTRPEGWKTDYARLRPLLQDAIAELGHLGEAQFRRHGNPDQAARFTALIEAALTKVRQHQGRWPVLVIDGKNADYLASVREVDTRFGEIVSFIRTNAPR